MDPLALVVLFFFSIGVGVLGAVAGVGGGVLFTPLVLAFTDLDINFVRSTGLALAMMGSAFVVREFIEAGATRLSLMLFISVAVATGSAAGAAVGIAAVMWFGKWGEAVVRVMLGVLIVAVAVVMFFFRPKSPPSAQMGRVARALRLYGVFYDPAARKEVEYGAGRLPQSFVLYSAVGFMSGVFGVGGGWALVPIANLVMGLPLKVAVATSKASFILGDMPGFWVYLNSGYVEPALLAAVMPGVAIGSVVGARIMLRTRARVVRYVVVATMLAAAIQLIARSLPHLLGG